MHTSALDDQHRSCPLPRRRILNMVYGPPSWATTIPLSSIPDSIPICDFILNEQHDRPDLANSRKPFVWGTSGEGYTPAEVRRRVDYLARALSREFGWQPNGGTEWDKVAGVFSHNTVSALFALAAFVSCIKPATFQRHSDMQYPLNRSRSTFSP